jgi:mannose-1-phosphate guanylyltransferase
MLRWTIKRAERLVDKSRIVAIVARKHRRWWETELSDLPEGNVLIQPEDKGTAAGILLPLLTILARDADARVLVLPCDHYVDDEELLHDSLLNAGRVAHALLRHVVLVGMTPTDESEDYG